MAQEVKVTSLMSQVMTDVSGKEGLLITVEYPPGGSDPIHRHARRVVTDVHARYFGIEMNDQSLTPGDNPRIGPTRFEDWLSRSIPQA